MFDTVVEVNSLESSKRFAIFGFPRHAESVSAVDDNIELCLAVRNLAAFVDQLSDRLRREAQAADRQFLAANTVVGRILHSNIEAIQRSTDPEESLFVPEPFRTPVREVLYRPRRLLQRGTGLDIATNLCAGSLKAHMPWLYDILQDPAADTPVQRVSRRDRDGSNEETLHPRCRRSPRVLQEVESSRDDSDKSDNRSKVSKVQFV